MHVLKGADAPSETPGNITTEGTVDTEDDDYLKGVNKGASARRSPLGDPQSTRIISLILKIGGLSGGRSHP
jgi:hypothetical protein